MKPIRKDTIRMFGGKILGYVETDAEGNQQVRNFGGKILGTYDKRCDVTRDFSGRKITQGNTVLGFLYQDLDKNVIGIK